MTHYLTDPQFEKGLASFPPGGGNRSVLTFGNSNGDPDVFLAQHWSRYDIATDTLQMTANGSYYEDSGKMVGRFKEGEKTFVRLAVFAQNEYTAPRKDGEGWPHLLLEQSFNPDLPLVSSVKALPFSLTVRISQIKNWMGDAFNPELHTAQTTFYLTVQDHNHSSKGYLDYLWFGIPIFDARYTFPSEFYMKDGGKADCTSKMIYVPGGDEFLKTAYAGVNPADGDWATCNIDLLPYIKKAFSTAKVEGFLPNSSWEDMRLGSFNLGWEVQGTFSCCMDVCNWQLSAT